jgi:hypothetical protein
LIGALYAKRSNRRAIVEYASDDGTDDHERHGVAGKQVTISRFDASSSDR